MNPTREKLIEAAKAGQFLDVCYGLYLGDNAELKQILAELHNEGAIDLLVEFARLGNKEHPAPDFFIMRDLFANVLPNLAVAVKKACECVKLLADRAGQDLAAGMIWEAYQQFLERDEKRIEEGLRLVIQGDAPAVSLSAVFLAGFSVDFGVYFEKCADIVRNRAMPDEYRAHALWAFSRLRILSNAAQIAGKILDLLEQLCEGQESESVLGNIPLVAVGCIVHDSNLGGRVQSIVASVSKPSFLLVQYNLSRAGILYAKKMPLPLMRCVLFHLVGARMEHKGILCNIDHILANLLESSHEDMAIEFLHEFVAGHERGERIIELSSTLQLLVLNPNKALDIFVTRCFLSSDRAHLFAVDQLVRHFHGQQQFGVSIDTAQLFEPKTEVAYYLARKAVGYFYYIPEACVSYVVSALDAMGDAERRMFKDIFINPFALSYSDYLEEYLSDKGAQLSDVARDFLADSCSAAKRHFADIGHMGEIKELLPYASQSEIHNRRWALVMGKAMAEAHKNSLVAAICTNVNLLHGRGWVTYMPGKNGATHRQVDYLKKMGTSVAFPALWNVDPFGLDYSLRICRAERIVK